LTSRATQTCWNKNVCFQQGNLNPLMIYWLKNLTDLVKMHPALYVIKVNTVWNVSPDGGVTQAKRRQLY
jgi:hypothetical protein